jgi:glutathione S-transferase
MKLYSYGPSGNCYKVRLILAQLGIACERVEVPLPMSPPAAAEYRTLSPLGRTPALVLDDGQVLAESNAILWYLGEGTPLVPADRLGRARALQWMFWEQYDHEPYIAVLRSWLRYFGVPEGRAGEIEMRRKRGWAALDVMERHLAAEPFFVGGRYGVADIALYAYTHVADEGGFSLERYPAIRAWIDRVRGQPGHIAITD